MSRASISLSGWLSRNDPMMVSSLLHRDEQTRKLKADGTIRNFAREILGELTLSGPNTSLFLHDKDEFSTIPDQGIKGVLHDLTKVSLIRCILMSGLES